MLMPISIRAIDPQFLVTRQIELFAEFCNKTVDRVISGELAITDGADIVYDRAAHVGLVIAVGDDVVQGIMAGAFARVPR